MLKIGKTYIERVDGTSRLCADLTIGNHRATLWFGVDSSQEGYLTLGRADAFVMALLPTAMRGGHEVVCEDLMSERLHYQLTSGLIPSLAFTVEIYHFIKITAPLTSEPVPNQGAVGTGFSGGVDSLYTIMRHGVDSELPLTHIAMFNTGNLELAYGKVFVLKNFQKTVQFAAEQNLQAVYVDTNFKSILPEYYMGVYTFRNLACALALSGLFAVYLLSSGPAASKLEFNPRMCNQYDLLTVNCVSTEYLSFYLSGVETTRVEKLTALTGWDTSKRWLHPCIGEIGNDMNCGHCKKCIRDMTVLYGLGELENYRTVYDVEDYLQHLPERIGYVLAVRNSNTCSQIRQLLEERQVPIPPVAYIYAKQFCRAVECQKFKGREEEPLC